MASDPQIVTLIFETSRGKPLPLIVFKYPPLSPPFVLASELVTKGTKKGLTVESSLLPANTDPSSRPTIP